jgi:hypothetical protein
MHAPPVAEPRFFLDGDGPGPPPTCPRPWKSGCAHGAAAGEAAPWPSWPQTSAEQRLGPSNNPDLAECRGDRGSWAATEAPLTMGLPG